MRILCKRLLLCVCLLSWSAGVLAKLTAATCVLGESGKYYQKAQNREIAFRKKYKDKFKFVSSREPRKVDALFMFSGFEYPNQIIISNREERERFVSKVKSFEPDVLFWIHDHAEVSIDVTSQWKEYFGELALFFYSTHNFGEIRNPESFYRDVDAFLKESPAEERQKNLKANLKEVNEKIEKIKKKLKKKEKQLKLLSESMGSLELRLAELIERRNDLVGKMEEK